MPCCFSLNHGASHYAMSAPCGTGTMYPPQRLEQCLAHSKRCTGTIIMRRISEIIRVETISGLEEGEQGFSPFSRGGDAQQKPTRSHSGPGVGGEPGFEQGKGSARSDFRVLRCHFQKYGYTHLSAGDLLRAERKRPGSQYGELIEKYIREGKIVPVEITISLLKREMDETMAANVQKSKFLIDGFPRNQDNLQGWNKTMEGKADVAFVLFFDCDNEVCIERCLERGRSSGRSDDNRESLEKRIQTYLQSTKPIIDLYEKMGKVRKVDASKSVDEVFDRVVTIFDKEG
uniref:Cytidine/uridine monophosphate kinase 1 n=1 Tax=Ornithorhynchus anatinus TaxID=9258 RepID=A0A6I8NKH2_ORNAN